jgi:hypothetical protein
MHVCFGQIDYSSSENQRNIVSVINATEYNVQ